MSTVTPLATSSTVTIDTPALPSADPVAERAKEIVAKQQQRLADSTKLVVTAVLDALESRPAIRDSERFKVAVDDSMLRAYRNNEGASEAANYGIAPYLRDAASFDLFKESVRAALGNAFGTTVISQKGLELIVEIGVAKRDTPVVAQAASRALVPAGSSDLAITQAITGQLNARRNELNSRRAYFAELAKSPAMRAIAKLATERFGSRQAITLLSERRATVILRGDGRVVDDGVRKALSDDALLALDMNVVAARVESILTEAAEGKLPAAERWRTPWQQFWNAF